MLFYSDYLEAARERFPSTLASLVAGYAAPSTRVWLSSSGETYCPITGKWTRDREAPVPDPSGMAIGFDDVVYTSKSDADDWPQEYVYCGERPIALMPAHLLEPDMHVYDGRLYIFCGDMLSPDGERLNPYVYSISVRKSNAKWRIDLTLERDSYCCMADGLVYSVSPDHLVCVTDPQTLATKEIFRGDTPTRSAKLVPV
jgi:hypothetical protein